MQSQLERRIQEITQTIPGVREAKIDVHASGAEALG
jgi:hypothetical protein